MESPNKRLKMTSPTFDAQTDFVPLGVDDDEGAFPRTDDRRASGISHANNNSFSRRQNRSNDSRNALDRPKSKHALPGHEPWVLVKTKFKRRFVFNTVTRASLWKVPKELVLAVEELTEWEKDQKEKNENAKWAEEQLKQMRDKSKASKVNDAADAEGRSRRRRSESLQREDEEALMVELAAQAEHTAEKDAQDAVKSVQSLQPQTRIAQGLDYESDSSYEVVEVTDSEGEEGDQHDDVPVDETPHGQDSPAEDVPVEFGEEDFQYQLDAMGEDYGLDPGEYGEDQGEWEEGAEGLSLSEDDRFNLFRDLLDDYRISPFTPWEKLIADESETSILQDDRYSVLPTLRARKHAWDVWARDKVAQLKQERAAVEKQDPKIPYLAFLHANATPKLYWPEFKRKFKREPELNDRKFGDKDREKLYRDHISRLKLSENTRKADFQILLDGVTLKSLNRDTAPEALPQKVLGHLHYISLPSSVRDAMLKTHISKLPPAPDDDDITDEQRAEADKKREERRRREKAMAERERRVEEERNLADKAEARARRELKEGEREIQAAMSSNGGLRL